MFMPEIAVTTAIITGAKTRTKRENFLMPKKTRSVTATIAVRFIKRFVLDTISPTSNFRSEDKILSLFPNTKKFTAPAAARIQITESALWRFLLSAR